MSNNKVFRINELLNNIQGVKATGKAEMSPQEKRLFILESLVNYLEMLFLEGAKRSGAF